MKKLTTEEPNNTVPNEQTPSAPEVAPTVAAVQQTEEKPEPMVYCENLVKIFKTGEIEVIALQGLDLTVEKGELTAIIGNSGSGKSTLLNLLGGLDRPSAGILRVNGQNMLKFTEQQMVEYKRRTVGFVWQNNARNLIPYLTAQQNIELPLSIVDPHMPRQKRVDRAKELLDMVGLSHRLGNRLSQLSGGEQQRVAIALALANNPALLLADEPTGAVDMATVGMILDIFNRLNRELGLTIIIVTHDRQLSRKVNRVVAIRDGRTSSEFIRSNYADEIAANARRLENTNLNFNIESHEEFVVLDRTGRLQIPKEYLERLNLKGGNKLKMSMTDDTITLERPQDKPEEAESENKGGSEKA